MLVKYASLFLLLGFTLNSQAQGTEEIDRFEKVDLDKVLETAKSFSSSKTTDELLKWVRDPERVKPLITSYYERNELPMVSIVKLRSSEASVNGDLISMAVNLRDFSSKTLAFQDSTDGYKIDWESWVAYSDVSWEEFMKNKPDKAFLFRVRSQRSNYYNFEFKDDKKWVNFRLLSPDGNHTIEGYAEFGSEAHKKLREIHFDPSTDPNADLYFATKGEEGERTVNPDRKSPDVVPITVKLRFPPNSRSNKMVIIDEVVQPGWVFPSNDEESK